jgi:hypothetical protein
MTSAPATSPSPPHGAKVLRGTPAGGGDHPDFWVHAPRSWSANGFYVWDDTDGPWLAISVWDVGEVARNPCHSIGHLYDPGPTVDDLAGALEGQALRHATEPTAVTLAGYDGKYLEWSVPTGAVVTGDSDFAGCDVQPNGHRDFVSWLGKGGDGERYQQMAGQVDRLWILNVAGQRLVIDATHSPDATQAQLDEEDRIVRSLWFVNTT